MSEWPQFVAWPGDSEEEICVPDSFMHGTSLHTGSCQGIKQQIKLERRRKCCITVENEEPLQKEVVAILMVVSLVKERVVVGGDSV